ncbi:hypothetical protein TGAM01_v209116 [Trichoderma gamsii]|uniref:Uncharacterized protein n=1 Tax=Trichoderma gamsii TaxID=398673 RepID=A0A2P4ZCL9_9HYPO|nr:hypothetical protein TGAM01_v209116 [Trichoderma gamsii]PON22046.1 hypothetical protein TGAM01_v209116 [Trichoderma gamsii]
MRVLSAAASCGGEHTFTCYQKAQTVVAFHPIVQPIFITAGATPALAQARASRDSRRQERLPSCRAQVTPDINDTASSTRQRHYDKGHDGRAEGGESETSRSGPRWRFPPGHSSVCLCFCPRLLADDKIAFRSAVLSPPTPYGVRGAIACSGSRQAFGPVPAVSLAVYSMPVLHAWAVARAMTTTWSKGRKDGKLHKQGSLCVPSMQAPDTQFPPISHEHGARLESSADLPDGLPDGLPDELPDELPSSQKEPEGGHRILGRTFAWDSADRRDGGCSMPGPMPVSVPTYIACIGSSTMYNARP